MTKLIESLRLTADLYKVSIESSIIQNIYHSSVIIQVSFKCYSFKYYSFKCYSFKCYSFKCHSSVIIQVLSFKCYHSSVIIQVSFKCYSSVIQVLFTCYSSVIQVLFKCYSLVVQVSFKCYSSVIHSTVYSFKCYHFKCYHSSVFWIIYYSSVKMSVFTCEKDTLAVWAWSGQNTLRAVVDTSTQK